MFKNRSIQMKLVNDNKSDDATEAIRPALIDEAAVETLRTFMNDFGKKVAIGVVAYVAADTLRRVADNITSK